MKSRKFESRSKQNLFFLTIKFNKKIRNIAKKKIK